jgi:polyhydroxybutyrate depolymerase
MSLNSGATARARIALHMRILSIACFSLCAACLPRDDLSGYASGVVSDAPWSTTAAVQPTIEAVADASPDPRSRPDRQPPFDMDIAADVGSAVPSDPATSACDGADASRPPDCVPKPGAWRGKSTQQVLVAGTERSFIYYAPERLDPAVPAPILVVAHGFSLLAEELFAVTGYAAVADREGFLLAFPSGQGRIPWNIGEATCASELNRVFSAPGDDQGFIDEILTFVESDRNLDREHVYVTGFASGGYFASETGCLRPDVRAIASHSGGSRSLGDCSAGRKPVMIFHGLIDQVIPVECGVQTRARWADKNGCSADVDTRPVLGGTCEYSRDCPPGGQVALCLFDGLGQEWAGGTGQAASLESASELTWEFFQQYAW